MLKNEAEGKMFLHFCCESIAMYELYSVAYTLEGTLNMLPEKNYMHRPIQISNK